MNKTALQSIIITVVGLILTIAIIFGLTQEERTIPNYITIIGTVCSVIGLVIAYVNIIALKKITIETKDKLSEALQSVIQINSLVDVSRAIKINHEIQGYIRLNKLELAQIRIQDLKYMLLQFSSIKSLDELTADTEFKRLLIDFGIDLNTINDHLLNSKRKVDFLRIVTNLEELSTFLTKFETNIKSYHYDTAKHS